eukprot:m.176852 g.176852  ORF g.176852 m.176852 type:complete len:544 (+) comp31862_c0_seq1:70-1701(+)
MAARTRSRLPLLILFASVALISAGNQQNSSAQQLFGYLENWTAGWTKWWDNNIPGNCDMGCEEPSKYMVGIAPYSGVYYGFTLVTTDPTPDQIDCGTPPSPQRCMATDGNTIYAAAATKQNSIVVSSTTTDETSLTSGIVSIAEVCRLARQGPYTTPKICKITLGGWSDWARIGSNTSATQLAAQAARMVQWSFADGIDLDFEHLSEFAKLDDEMAFFATFVTALRTQLDVVQNNWITTAQTRITVLQEMFKKLQPWQQKESPYFATNIEYMNDIVKNGKPPKLEISFTTRFNSFLDPADPFNYLMKGSPRPNSSFISDNEGAKLWPFIGSSIDAVNIMAYDASGLSLNFTQIILNAALKVPAKNIYIGFEPGNQAAGGIWEGSKLDLEATEFVARNGYGGAFIWAINADPAVEPDQARNAPELAANASSILKPAWPHAVVPKYTKVDPSTGWSPSAGPVPPSPPPPTPPSPPTPPTPPPPSPPSPPPTPPTPPPSPGSNCTTKCHSISARATDLWCKENCCHDPPNCPSDLCSCTAKPYLFV